MTTSTTITCILFFGKRGRKVYSLDHKIPLGRNGISISQLSNYTPSVTPSPSATPSPTTITAPPTDTVTYGDVNGDGRVNSSDVALLKRYLLGLVENINKEAADVNVSGTVNSTDLAIMKRYVLRSISELPYK